MPIRRLNTCPNPDCGHYSWNHGEFGCKTINCECKATGLALALAEKDHENFVNNSGMTKHNAMKSVLVDDIPDRERD